MSNPLVNSHLQNCTKNTKPVTCLATMPYVYAACPVCITIFSTGGKFRPVPNFTELHALTLAAHSYALLLEMVKA